MNMPEKLTVSQAAAYLDEREEAVRRNIRSADSKTTELKSKRGRNINSMGSDDPASQIPLYATAQRVQGYEPAVVTSNYALALGEYLQDPSTLPLTLLGNAADVLADLPDECIDCAMTSPPYWNKREYANGGIGLEQDYSDYIRNLAAVFLELQRTLKPRGSFWLNIGDSYLAKQLVGIPWRVAFEMTDNQGWILRNSVIWNKVKSGMDTAKDRLGNVHENIFHFVKQPQYYYDVDSIRSNPQRAKIVNGAVVSATGVSGVRYRRQIELSTALGDEEKVCAVQELDKVLNSVAEGRLADFRMIIRGQQRTTHSDSSRLSGRAKELRDRGFYFLRNHPNGAKPTDVWDIIPEDTQERKLHFAPYPVDLCLIPITGHMSTRWHCRRSICGNWNYSVCRESAGP